jgi:uncharacterized membrane protein YvbJ
MAIRFCTSCGKAIEGDGRFCTNCGAPIQPEEPQQQYYQPQPEPQPVKQQPVGMKPKNYLALSILATILCCLPFGIPAIVFSARVDNYWNAGNYQEAQEASRKAKTWMLISVIIGAVGIISYLALVFMGVAAMGSDFLEELGNYR